MDKKTLDTAFRAHSNLNTFQAVIAVLEGGCVYGGVGSDKAVQRIIKLARTEQQRLLKLHDTAIAKGEAK